MQSMKAFCIPAEGEAPVLMKVSVPRIDADDVLVRISAVGVGVHDGYTIPSGIAYPYPIGLEAAGTIVNVGSAVIDFQPGDRVMITGMHPKGGTWAEFAAVNQQSLMPVPAGLEFREAAALPVAGNTALEGVKALAIGSGDTLFIAGASGAIGTLAIQLAIQRGYRVAASASPANHDYLRSLGAEFAVDYNDPDWILKVREWAPDGVDAALAIQRGTGQSSLPVVRDGGRVITISGDQIRTERDVHVEQMMHHPDTRPEFLQIAADVASGRIRVVVEHVYPFEQGLEALAKTKTRHARGKIILTLDPGVA